MSTAQTGKLSINHVVGLILRTIYLRCAAKPHQSWIASSTAVHIAESTGLHREIGEIQEKSVPQLMVPSEENLRRRIFWAAIALNHFISAEYGRTKTQIHSITCQPLQSPPGDFTAEVVNIMQSVPEQRSLGYITVILAALDKITTTPVKAPFLSLLRADACSCIYRMFCSTGFRVPMSKYAQVLQIIGEGIDGVDALNTRKQPWWNLISTPFISICTLLSIGTAASLAIAPTAFETLNSVVETYKSRSSVEALRIARTLVEAARHQKARELEVLDRSLSVITDISSNPVVLPNVGHEMDANDVGMADFLDFGNLEAFEYFVPNGIDGSAA